MKLREDEPMDPQVERELRAIDAALAGGAVDPDLTDLAELAATLAEMRSTPAEEFAAELDARAAAGFGGGRAGLPSRLAERFRARPRSRQLLPVAASALAAIVIATAVVSFDEEGGGEGAATTALEEPATGGAAPAQETVAPAAPAAGRSEGAVPLEEQLRSAAGDRAASGLGGVPARSPIGPFASGERRRFVERNAELILGTEAEQLRSVTDDVFAVIGRYDGIVLSSQIEDGPEGQAGAEFRLLVPSPRLGDALADLSQLAEVRSREETTRDITAPVVTVEERLQDARAEVQGLLKQLAEADTDEERAQVEAQLRFQRQRVAGLRFSLNRLERRANLSTVTLEIVTGDAASFGEGDDEWTIGDAIDDAGRILAVAAGVTLIGLAVIAPIALIGALALLGRRAWVRQGRERALEG